MRWDVYPKAQDKQAAISAEVYLLIATAKAHGLIDGPPSLNIDHAQHVLRTAREAGTTYTDDDLRDALLWTADALSVSAEHQC